MDIYQFSEFRLSKDIGVKRNNNESVKIIETYDPYPPRANRNPEKRKHNDAHMYLNKYNYK